MTELEIDYASWMGPEKFIIRLDPSQEVQEYEIGTSRLRTYTMKARYVIVRNLVNEKEAALKESQEEGF